MIETRNHIKMSESSKEFLEDHLPEALQAENYSDLLEMLYDFIDDEGFEPPDYDEYNLLGSIAQDVYDDILYCNAQK